MRRAPGRLAGWGLALTLVGCLGRMEDAAPSPVANEATTGPQSGQSAPPPEEFEKKAADPGAPAAPPEPDFDDDVDQPVRSRLKTASGSKLGGDEGKMGFKGRGERLAAQEIANGTLLDLLAAEPTLDSPFDGEPRIGASAKPAHGRANVIVDKAGKVDKADADKANKDRGDLSRDATLRLDGYAAGLVAADEGETKEEAEEAAGEATGEDGLDRNQVAPAEKVVVATEDARAKRKVPPRARPATVELDLLPDDDGGVARAESERPSHFLPRTFYFENTYLGGNAAYEERLRRLDADFGGMPRPYLQAELPDQAFDTPDSAGIQLTAALDRRWLDKPGRVYLQVGLQGSTRFGWRRPPLDLALVVDASVAARDVELVVAAVRQLLRGLGPQDRLGVYLAGAETRALAALAPLRDARITLMRKLEALPPSTPGPESALADAIRVAGAGLQAAAGDTARVPGTQTVLILTEGSQPGRVEAASQAAHALSLQGVVTSVVDLGDSGAWWATASAGNGNYHQVAAAPNAEGRLADAVDEELASLARVVGRLLRINVRLAPNVHAVRVMGSRALTQTEVRQVKDREEATDQNLSRTLGVAADRGADDDGIQTVIPYFYGGDDHVILLELWVDAPGPVADVTLKYKDMVRLENATARASASLATTPKAHTPSEAAVQRNLRGFVLAELLGAASARAQAGDLRGAQGILLRARRLGNSADERLVGELITLLARGDAQLSARALAMARDRRVGQ